MNKRQNLILIIGSGFSIPAGFPSVKFITEKILSDPSFQEEFSKALHALWRKDKDIPDYHSQNIAQYLHFIKDEIERCTKTKDAVNYEDIYFAGSQIRASICGDNPTAEYFKREVQTKMSDLLTKIPISDKNDWGFNNIVEDALLFIEFVVIQLLSKEPARFDYLKLLTAIYDDSAFDQIDIFTLNHDLLIEKYFYRERFEDFVDGFHESDTTKPLLIWKPEVFHSNKRVRLFKLHGSLGWYPYNQLEDTNDPRVQIVRPSICRRKIGDSELLGMHEYLREIRPKILVGTTNKLERYTEPFYFDMYSLFYNSMCSKSQLVIIGYGFHDKGINILIQEWSKANHNRNAIIIDKIKFKSIPPVCPFKQPDEDDISRVEWERIKKLL